jgi:nitrous oxide reductase accessory protein NosL
MDDQQSTTLDRRTMLALVGTSSAAALAGCAGGDGSTETGTTTAPETTTDQVPEAYRTATGLGGSQRSPDSLAAKSDLNYQTEPKDGQQCSGCAYYIPDKNGDGVGACTLVEGTIEPSGWCTSYVAHEAPTTGTEADAVSPTDVPEDAKCAVCNMAAANFPEWNAQAVHADDTREYFCTAGCATTYYAVPEQFAASDADLAGLWVRDLDSRDIVDGTTAYYALETDADRLDDPMRVNPAPFAAREDAVAYVDEVDHLTEDDVVELSAFDRELAEQYRGKLIE